MDEILLWQTCLSLSPQLPLPQRTALEREKKKKRDQHTKPKPKSRHIHLGCSSLAGDLLPLCSSKAAETKARKVPATVRERLFSVLLHCVKWGGSRLTPALPVCQHPLPAPGIWAVLGWLPRPHHRTSPFHSLLTHAQGQAHAPALVLLREWPPANLKGERLGLLQGTRSLAQRLSSLGKTLLAWSNSPHSPPAFAGTSHTQQFGRKKNGAKSALSAGIFLLPWAQGKRKPQRPL